MSALQPIFVDAWQFDGMDPINGPAKLAAAGEPWCGMIHHVRPYSRARGRCSTRDRG